MRISKALLTGAAAVALSVFAAEPAMATGPTYAWQYGRRTADVCINDTSGGTAVGGWAAGQFVANSDGGGGCSVTYLELIYVNNNGVEVAKHVQVGWSGTENACGASCAQIVIPRSSYRRIVEVIGSSTSGKTGTSTGGTYLYF